MLFGSLTRVGPINHVLDAGQHPPREWALFGVVRPTEKHCESLLRCTQQKSSIMARHAMWPFVKILWPVDIIILLLLLLLLLYYYYYYNYLNFDELFCHLCSGKTQIISQPRTLFVDKFHEAKFNCTSVTDVEEIHLLNITWSHDGRPISNDTRHHVTQTTTSRVTSQLRIYDVSGPDNGRYECMATNGLDTAISEPAYLLVKGNT